MLVHRVTSDSNTIETTSSSWILFPEADTDIDGLIALTYNLIFTHYCALHRTGTHTGSRKVKISLRNIEVKRTKMSRPRFELRTACVLDRSDNQLHHRPVGEEVGECLASGLSRLLRVTSREMARPASVIDCERGATTTGYRNNPLAADSLSTAHPPYKAITTIRCSSLLPSHLIYSHTTTDT